MPLWFLLALSAQICWSLSVLIDKYIVERYVKSEGIGGLYIFSGIVGAITAVVLGALVPTVFVVPPWYALVALLNGTLMLGAFVPYYIALRQSEASAVTPMYRMIPVFALVLGYIALGETISLKDIVAGIVVIVGSIGISADVHRGLPRFNTRTVWLMAVSSFLIALSILLFKVVAIETSFWTTTFWQMLGSAALSVVLFVIPQFRRQFFVLLRENTVGIITINVLNEAVSLAGSLMSGYASLLAPIALIAIVGGFQPALVFLFAIIATVLFPKFIKEHIDRRTLIYKTVFIAIIFVGAYFLQ